MGGIGDIERAVCIGIPVAALRCRNLRRIARDCRRVIRQQALRILKRDAAVRIKIAAEQCARNLCECLLRLMQNLCRRGRRLRGKAQRTGGAGARAGAGRGEAVLPAGPGAVGCRSSLE